LTTAGWAALVVLGPIAAIALVVWVAENRSGAPAGDALRLAMDGWLLAHGIPLSTPGGRFSMIPLLLTAVIVRQLYRAGRSTALATGATSWPGVAQVAAAVGVLYGLFAVVAALAGATADVRADPGAAGLIAGVLAGASAAWGAARVAGLGAVTTALVPEALRRGLLGGAVAAAAVLTAGVVAVAAQTVVTHDEFMRVFASLQGGVVGGIAIVGLCVLYAPTAAVWAAAYLIGPGFSVGVGTSVDAGNVVLGAFPAFPLLAAVPTRPASAMVSLVLAAPLVAGLLAGAVTARDLPRWRIALGGALIAGPVAGVLVGLAGGAANGALGSGQLGELGPSGWHVGIVLAVEVAVAALVGATVARTLASWSAWSAARRGNSATARRGNSATARRGNSAAARRGGNSTWLPQSLRRFSSGSPSADAPDEPEVEAPEPAETAARAANDQ
jgi:hypothetical protein